MRPDVEFLRELRAAVEEYLAAVDHWETANRQYQRLSLRERGAFDIQSHHFRYAAARRLLTDRIPRAVHLCRRYGLHDPFSGLMRTDPGSRAMQSGVDSAVGRGERTALTRCLVELDEAVRTPEVSAGAPANKGIMQRILDFFF